MSRVLRGVALDDLEPEAALDVLRAALDGSADAVLPLPRAGADNGLAASLAASLGEGRPFGYDEDDAGDPTALVLGTSGSTGTPKGALLPASALTASAQATHARIGGDATWLLALAAHHVAGVQVLVRSLLAGTVPQRLDLTDGFQPAAFADATYRLRARTAGRRATALVPTQLVRLLDAGGRVLEALTAYDAVLLGGAAAAPSLLARAEDAGVKVVTTYGMSETSGGCVYDGRPLDDVRVRLDPDGRVLLGGPVVARGYRGRPRLTARGFSVDEDGTRWFRTEDHGERAADGRLTVLGRLDDAIVTGGLKIAPSVVEAALTGRAGVREVVVVGVPDEQWGETVAAVVVAEDPERAPSLASVRAALAEEIPAYAAPRRVIVLPELPLRGPGKPDRAEAARLAAQHS